jgi:hypothetical protein
MCDMQRQRAFESPPTQLAVTATCCVKSLSTWTNLMHQLNYTNKLILHAPNTRQKTHTCMLGYRGWPPHMTKHPTLPRTGFRSSHHNLRTVPTAGHQHTIYGHNTCSWKQSEGQYHVIQPARRAGNQPETKSDINLGFKRHGNTKAPACCRLKQTYTKLYTSSYLKGPVTVTAAATWYHVCQATNSAGQTTEQVTQHKTIHTVTSAQQQQCMRDPLRNTSPLRRDDV